MASAPVHAGSLADLERDGRVLTKVGSLPVVVFWHDGEALAIEDRCPHMGFPLHQGTVEAGLVTCHWHHARFDLVSGCTLDLWADDAKGFDTEVRDGEVYVHARAEGDAVAHLQRRLREGLEENISLVIAKSVFGLLDVGQAGGDVVETGLDFGTRYRDQGWGAGLTTLVAMANLLPHLEPDDRARALIHGLAYVARDTAGRPPRFPVGALESSDVPSDRLAVWYRRFIDTRSSDAAERTLETALHNDLDDVERMMFAAATDHVFIDEGHTIDFTNKAFESLAHVGNDHAPSVLPTLVRQTAGAFWSEETSEWRYPHDLAGLSKATIAALPDACAAGADRRGEFADVGKLAWQFLEDDPDAVCMALLDAIRAGADEEQVGRAIAYAAALRIVRFHVQNDHGDWNTVHHSFTSANALHQALRRNPTPELLRGAVHAVLRVYLDRFLNVPAARMPQATSATLVDLEGCFEQQGAVDDAGNAAFGLLRSGGSRGDLIRALGHALLAEDAEFHWFQTVEAGVQHALSWPDESEESALTLVAVARFLSAHTPTRRELPTVMKIATRLRRGEALYEEAPA